VVDHIDLDTPSTKEMLGFIDKMGVKKPLIVLHEPNDAVSKSVRNIPDARAINVGNINVYDLLNYQNLILTQEAVARIEEVYSI
jgi:large subunit ribosomal protein L4